MGPAAMQLFAREPVGSAEGRNLAPDFAFLTLPAFNLGFPGSKLLQIGLDQRGNGRIEFGRSDPGAFIGLVVN